AGRDRLDRWARAAGELLGAEPGRRPPRPGADLRRPGDRRTPGRRPPAGRPRARRPAGRGPADARLRHHRAAAAGGGLMGLRGEAAIIGIAELPAEKKQSGPARFTLEQYAELSRLVIEDAGVPASVVNGLVTHGIQESDMFAPATLAEYLGIPVDFGERVDLGGATSAGMVWRAAAAVELGICDAVLCVVPGSMILPRPADAKPPAQPLW